MHFWPAFGLILKKWLCSVFESSIRYVGGLLSAYELSGKKHAFIVEKAKELANRLSLAWSQVSGIFCAIS